MARQLSPRINKRYSARLKNRPMVGTSTSAESYVDQDDGVDLMDTTNGATGTIEEDANTQDIGRVLIDGQEHSDMSFARRDKGKGRAVEEVAEEMYFDFMELPTELRLEIYRACLTRPYKILLSKAMEVPQEPAEADIEELSDADFDAHSTSESDDRRNAMAAFQRLRAARGLPPRSSANLILGRAGRTGNQSRPLNHLARPTAPRRRQFNTFQFPAAFVPPTTASSSTANATGPTTTLGHTAARPIVARQSQRPPKGGIRNTSAKNEDPLIVNILRTNKAIYKEARSVLYSENVFDLSIDTAVSSLAALHQRSRRLIRHVELEIPSYTEIQDKFSEVVRLSLRYCSGLRKLVIHTPFCLPGGDGNATPNSNTQIWAQGFDILRWLPQPCEVVLMGHKNAEIDEVVNKHLHLAKTLTPVAYAHRQLMPTDSDRSMN